LLTFKKGPRARISPQERLEIWMAFANMERLAVKDKIEFGRILLSELKAKKVRPQLFWSLSRIGARELFYGPVDCVIPPNEIENWISNLMENEWVNIKAVGTAISQMARKTGDRMRDLSPEFMNQVIQWMRIHDLADEMQLLTSIKPMATREESVIFGEALPSGIVLHE